MTSSQQNENSFFQISEIKLPLYIHPSKLENLKSTIKEQLNSLLMRYFESLQGVFLCYSHERILSHFGDIFPDTPFLRVFVGCTALIFTPQIGHSLSGKITRIGADFIHALIFNIFPVIIPASDISPLYRYSSDSNSWIGDHIALKLGDLMIFSISKLNVEFQSLTLRGTLKNS